MEHRVNVDEVRKKANAFLRDLLDQSTARSSEEIAHNITNLAFEDGNPVRDLFLTALPTGKPCLPWCYDHLLHYLCLFSD